MFIKRPYYKIENTGNRVGNTCHTHLTKESYIKYIKRKLLQKTKPEQENKFYKQFKTSEQALHKKETSKL